MYVGLHLIAFNNLDYQISNFHSRRNQPSSVKVTSAKIESVLICMAYLYEGGGGVFRSARIELFCNTT